MFILAVLIFFGFSFPFELIALLFRVEFCATKFVFIFILIIYGVI